MAFVIRSERFTSKVDDNISGPGSYDLIKDSTLKINTEQEIPFFSSSKRNPEYINKDSILNPGPGYYEKNNQDLPFYQNNYKLKRDRSAQLQKFIVYDAFNLNSLNKLKNNGNNPGPGSYDIPNTFGNIPKYLLNRKINLSTGNINNRAISAFEDRRVISIPNQKMDYGYEIDDNGEIYHSNNPYNLSPKSNQKISFKSNKSRGNLITSARKYSSKFTNVNTISDDDHDDSIENSILMNKYNNIESKVFNPNNKVYSKRERVISNYKINDETLMNSNLSLSEKMDVILNSSDFQNSPGPGYYSSIDPEKQNYIKKRNLQSFGSFAKRFPENKIIKKKEYNSFIENDDENIKNIEENKEKYFNRRKIDKLGIARDKKHEKELINRRKEEMYDIVGPGRYDINNKHLQQKSWNKNYDQFGSFSKRFEYNENDSIPGPGDYDIRQPIISEKKQIQFKKPSKIKYNLNEINTIDFSPEESMFKNKKKEKKENILINSVEYILNDNKKSKLRPFNSIKLEREKIIKQKFLDRKLQEEKNKSNIGPGSYNVAFSDFERNKGLIFSKSPRLVSAKNYFDSEDNVGPGAYYKDRYGDWVKPTHNVLFV